MSDAVFEYMGYKIPIHLVNLTGAGPETFDTIARHHFQTLNDVVGIAPDHTVLEIGCGIGRDAMQLTNIITEGTYIGVDIIKPSIDWCTNNISRAYSNFRFFHLDIQDHLHNPNGTLSTRDCKVPAKDNSVDRIILWSVFTHMLADDIAHYMREFKRVLKSDGLVYATCFVVNDDIIDAARRTNLTIYGLTFEHLYEQGCFVQDLERPAAAVAFTEEAIYKISRAGGLELAQPIIFGAWSGHHRSPYGQDAMVLQKRAIR
ncbi:class I SAM-dependent methyltransferase [Methylocystis sp. MJC1]|uniref:class I SAM-dependent methyltransferase n=1 Tax=Methylocystis sp. MJC1 TaxID=2654282 RepID=UPI0013ECF4C0|nr:class I SAM-dependent methyltransferase [Methylocystis sp. MJC1]KAF2990052.1 tRNA (guanine-N(7)-)-methyltransferase [Methylocystis sp. MJC1]MBU6528748.1 class I SAM-dependent methyltransferase [Methylocystis sp. MJC1]UZX11635.1 class I SAM-dependent methyltransferase [Methylocystis sp. MJC1]